MRYQSDHSRVFLSFFFALFYFAQEIGRTDFHKLGFFRLMNNYARSISIKKNCIHQSYSKSSFTLTEILT